MSLNMQGHIDSVFKSVSATRISKAGGSYVNGVWVPSPETRGSYTVNMQPLNDKEIYFLSIGAERVQDVRKIYVNDGDLESIGINDDWEILGQRWKAIRTDNRPWRKYCRIIVERYDDQN